MVSRICPHCNATWYSADAEGVWICPECGAEIPSQEEKKEDKKEVK